MYHCMSIKFSRFKEHCTFGIRTLALSIPALVLASCTQTLPKAELVSYTSAYSEVHALTNSVLDIVIPYERMVIRQAIRSRSQTVTVPGVRANCQNPEIFADGKCPFTTQPSTKTTTRRVATQNTCLRGYGGPDPFCYELRDGFATIGDPPLAGAYRNLSDVVQRFNTILVAYANGTSIQFVQQDLSGLSTSIAVLTNNPYFAGATQPASQAIGQLIQNLVPMAKVALDVRDRKALKNFLIDNYDLVDTALRQMAENSPTLYSNVGVGTQLFELRRAGSSANLRPRRQAIRKIVANWTVVIEDTRVLLATLRTAIENPNNLEVRLRNLGEPAVTARSNIEFIKKQIATLDGPPELP